MRKTISLSKNPLLVGPTLQSRNRTGSPYREIGINEIDVDPEQPRRVFDADSLRELSDSIKQYGVISPVLVRPAEGGMFRLIAGERRLRASMMAGLKTIPAIVDQEEGENKDSILLKQLVENLQRQDLSSLERAVAIGQLKTKFSLSVREIASKLGISKSLVQRSLDILTIPEDLQAALASGSSESKILILSAVQDSEIRRQLLSQLDAFNREQLAAEVEKVTSGGEIKVVSHGGTSRIEKKRELMSAEDFRIVDELQKSIGLKVSLYRRKGKLGGGKMVIDFYNEDGLFELHKRLIGVVK